MKLLTVKSQVTVMVNFFSCKLVVERVHLIIKFEQSFFLFFLLRLVVFLLISNLYIIISISNHKPYKICKQSHNKSF